jgi:heat shock protein HslJ
MKTPGSKPTTLLLCAILGTSALTTSCSTTSETLPAVSTQSLLDTQWRLTKLGDEVIENPPGERAIHFLLQASNTSLTGFSGCNRMFGRYALDGPSLKFDGLGGTRMFCQLNMELEQKFLDMFQNVASWKITGNTLQLFGASGNSVATFSTP